MQIHRIPAAYPQTKPHMRCYCYPGYDTRTIRRSSYRVRADVWAHGLMSGWQSSATYDVARTENSAANGIEANGVAHTENSAADVAMRMRLATRDAPHIRRATGGMDCRAAPRHPRHNGHGASRSRIYTPGHGKWLSDGTSVRLRMGPDSAC